MKTLSRQWYALVLSALVLSFSALVGCGGSSSGDSGPDVVNPDPDDDNDNDDDDTGDDDSDGDDTDGDGDHTAEPLTCDNPSYAEAMNLRIYQVMTESFIDGDPGIGHGVGYGTSHHSGDIRGIIDSLEYIKGLGFNAIWLTPVFDSVPLSGQDLAADRLDATGYYASNYFAIDPNFGSMDDARELVDTAHELGLYVFFDGVFGHFKNNAEEYPSVEGRTVTTGGASVAGTGRIAEYPDDLEFFKEVATYWVEELKIDGWRLDQAYQVPLGAWVEIRRAVEDASASVTYTNADGEAVNPLGYMVAEIWKGEADIAAEAYGADDNPALCSAFDFPVRYALVQALAVEENGANNPSAARLRSGFNSYDAYPDHAIPNGFMGNHDLVRFGDLLQRGDIADPQDDLYWARHKAAYSFLAAYTGPITLYYGEEIGEEVPDYADEVTANCADQGLCDDHVARTSGKVEGLPSGTEREVFVANEKQAELRDYLTELMELRAAQPALYRGERTAIVAPIDVAGALYADYKTYADDAVLYLLNVSDEPIETTFEACALGSTGALTNLLTDETINADQEGRYQIQIPASAALFLNVESPAEDGPGCTTSDGPVGSGPLAACDTPDADGTGPLASDMYIRGSYAGGDGFGATPSDRRFGYKGDNLYQVVVNEPSATSYGFKFANAEWTYEFAVAGSADVVLGAEQAMAVASGPGTESSIDIPESGDYVFSFQINDALDGGTMMVSQCAE
ncbi:alpha-amylase family glycosyl hydrolase [Marinimicrobium sp. LS-A18]|uniref:alpha-amylase family glycosyl hydrolase n=1 Tax=Marinimicrobium sp. LS-A18 TaxID=1381596 RepID=UPI000466526F|nr:alpha-amylase family glycosyl hydrolase [Marinimicrobium sp. LS-A18]